MDTMNAPHVAAEWDVLRIGEAEAMTDARLELDHAVQVIVSASISYLAARGDDSHTNLAWRPDITALVTHPAGLSFSELARLCDLTDGNLSRHLDVLSEAELVKITKGFEGRRPLTTCALTAHGRKRFREYLAQLEKVLRDAAAQEDASGEAAKTRTRTGLAGA